jgi:hypothetical protein
MKRSRSQVKSKSYGIPKLRFEDQELTSFSGLVVFQALFSRLDLKARLRRCFRHWESSAPYRPEELVVLLVVHLLLGFRHLREASFYRDDPMVLRLVGWSQLPDVSIVSRFLARCGRRCADALRELMRELVLERLGGLGLARITLDFDGSVQGTGRAAEGTAVGYNRRKKGQRSYYPLLCTVAQTGQILDFLHRPGNVHDSRGAADFIRQSIEAVRRVLPGVQVEVRMDGAFFSDEIVGLLSGEGVDFTISVPFRRFAELKQWSERRRFWHRINGEVGYFEKRWKPASWSRRFRFVFVRTRTRRRTKGPLQLDLFEPVSYGYDFKVVVTNKTLSARKLVAYHDGRGSQEGLFAELKSQAQGDYVPVRTLTGNQVFFTAATLAHNLNRELQMIADEPARGTTEQRSPLWRFQQLATLRRTVLLRAGRLTRPAGALTLTLRPNPAAKAQVLHFLEALGVAA